MKEKKVEEEEEKESEDWCFCCYDGGDLMICDHKGCLKVYHPGCVGKKKSSMNSGKRWTCSRHSCVACSGTSRFYCLCCPHASCRDCIGASELALLRGKNGLCKSCVKRILLSEENSEYGLEGEKKDLEDQDEWLFKEYWEIVKDQEGLTSPDVHSANANLKKRENQSCRFTPVIIGDSDDSKDLTESDSDTSGTSVTEIQKPIRTRKGSKRQEFIGWGSKPLLEFLRFIGKDTTEKLSRLDLDNIIRNYISDKELYVTKDKKKALCDQNLQRIFKTKFVFTLRIYNLLEEHLAENRTEESGSDEDEIELEDKKRGTAHEHKKRRLSSDTSIASDEEKACPGFQKSCFASIIPDNMKLVYIKKSLLQELLKEHDHSEGKILGSFVRVKNDCLDYRQRNTHQLSQVRGIKEIPSTNEVLLEVSYFVKDIPLSLLSDSNFTKEECEDLFQNIANGHLKKPTVVELEKKARELHQDITKHWIEKELVRLQNCIDWANEKGWRRELDEYLEQRELLRKPSEQERLFQQMPEIIAEVIDLESGSGSLDSLVINKA